MKPLVETLSLKGEIEVISISQMRALLGDVLTQVQMGKTFIITRNRKRIVRLIKEEAASGNGAEMNAFELGAAVRRMELAQGSY